MIPREAASLRHSIYGEDVSSPGWTGVVLLGPFAVAVWGLVLSVETQQRDDDVDASVAGSLWILGVLGASMFALLFVAGLCYCVCPSAAFCDNDENESVYCEDSPMVPICVHFLMFSFSIIGLAVACLRYAIIGYEASLEAERDLPSRAAHLRAPRRP